MYEIEKRDSTGYPFTFNTTNTTVIITGTTTQMITELTT